MKKTMRRAAILMVAMLITLACLLSACTNSQSKETSTGAEVTPAVEITDSAAGAPSLYSEYENVDWDSKTIKYNFRYVEHWSWGGVNGNDGGRYVTNYNKMFLDLFEDGTIVGYYLANNNNTLGTPGDTHFAPENRIRYQYVGYWEEDADGVVTMHTIMKDGVNNPTEYVTTTVTLPESGELRFDFYPTKTSDTDEKAKPYGLLYDGTVPYGTPSEQAEAINLIWDELLE